jgi:hypothetical protein
LSITVTPAAANFGASSFDDVAPRQGRARRTRGGKEPQFADREISLGQNGPHDRADLTGCAYNTNFHTGKANAINRSASRNYYSEKGAELLGTFRNQPPMTRVHADKGLDLNVGAVANLALGVLEEDPIR